MTSAAEKLAAVMPKIGEDAPFFELPNEQGKNISLASLKGKNIVVYFYPKDATPGCTTEGQNFRDAYELFQAQNTVILGVSKDSVKSHDKFKCKQNFPFDLLSDEEGDMCETYGVWVEKNMYGKKYMGIQRATFLIDENGKIANVWPKVSVKGHVDEVLEAVKSLS